jgi:hypothetical protein
MTPLRLIGKVSLSDEITMLERLKQTLVSAREQARFIKDSTGDADTKFKMDLFDFRYEIDRADLCIYRAKEAQKEADAETGRVSLQEDLGRS